MVILSFLQTTKSGEFVLIIEFLQTTKSGVFLLILNLLQTTESGGFVLILKLLQTMRSGVFVLMSWWYRLRNLVNFCYSAVHFGPDMFVLHFSFI